MSDKAGGLIAYGIATHQNDKTLPVDIEPIDQKNIETFDRVVNAQVRPPIIGLRRKLIPPDSPKVLLVDVPLSQDPPHQNLYDKKYYHRSGSECRPMEHDLIALKFGRKLSPILTAEFRKLTDIASFTGEPPWSNDVGLRVMIVNHGRRTGRDVILTFQFPSTTDVLLSTVDGAISNIEPLCEGRQARQFKCPQEVFHPGMAVRITDFHFQFSEEFARKKQEHVLIEWTLFCDEMDPQVDFTTMKNLGWLPP